MWPYTDDEAGWLTPPQAAKPPAPSPGPARKPSPKPSNDNDPARRLPARLLPAPVLKPVPD
jgi:hypothetical protein